MPGGQGPRTGWQESRGAGGLAAVPVLPGSRSPPRQAPAAIPSELTAERPFLSAARR